MSPPRTHALISAEKVKTFGSSSLNKGEKEKNGGGREGGREAGREGRTERGRERVRELGREGGREGGRE